MSAWYIEDAGGGCRSFSEVLVLVCENPKRVYYSYMPLSWDKKLTLEDKALQNILNMLKWAKVKPDDYLYVCSGNIFFGLHKWLDENGYQWETAKMDGLAHDLAEQVFQKQIIDAGFPASITLEERNYKDFYRQVDAWIKKDPRRAKYLKDFEVRCKPAASRYVLKGNSGRLQKCGTCGKRIQPYSPIVQYRYREHGKTRNCYYHPVCTPVEPHKCKLQEAHICWDGEKLQGVLLPAKANLPCQVCKGEIPIGDIAVHALKGKELVFGHPKCFGLSTLLSIGD